MAKKKNQLSIEDNRNRLLKKLKPKPKTTKDIGVGARVLQLGAFIKDKDRIGKVTGFKEEGDYIIMKFPDNELRSQLRFYGKGWGLLKEGVKDVN